MKSHNIGAFFADFYLEALYLEVISAVTIL